MSETQTPDAVEECLEMVRLQNEERRVSTRAELWEVSEALVRIEVRRGVEELELEETVQAAPSVEVNQPLNPRALNRTFCRTQGNRTRFISGVLKTTPWSSPFRP